VIPPTVRVVERIRNDGPALIYCEFISRERFDRFVPPVLFSVQQLRQRARLQLRRPLEHRRQHEHDRAHVHALVRDPVDATDEATHEGLVDRRLEQNVLEVRQKAHVVVGRPVNQQRHPDDDVQREQMRVTRQDGHADDEQRQQGMQDEYHVHLGVFYTGFFFIRSRRRRRRPFSIAIDRVRTRVVATNH
jgi:hypothetical protein